MGECSRELFFQGTCLINHTVPFSFARIETMNEKQDRVNVQSAFEAASERVFSARDVQRASGLTARQLNDWDERGALPHDREGETGWRRFSIREIFVLMVCAELRSKFGVSVERVKFVQKLMLQDDADHFASAVQLMEILGVGVWLLTDFEHTFIMDSELELGELWSMGLFGTDKPAAFALLKMNPLVNRLLACMKEPEYLPTHGRGYDIMHDIRYNLGGYSPEELEAIQLIRSGDYESVEIVAPNGKIETLYATARVDPSVDLNQIRREHPFQTLTVKMKNGKTVSVTQQTVFKPSSPKGQSQ